LIALLGVLTFIIATLIAPTSFTLRPYLPYLIVLMITPLVISSLVSFYIYDFSNLYRFSWLPDLDKQSVLNINAGFDETSEIFKNNYPKIKLAICDFYDPSKHTEISIKRARKKYPPLEGTTSVSTEKLPFKNGSFDYCLAILSAHEIRDEKERINFFKELNRVTKKSGKIFVTEHLRDVNNFMAYTIGFFHFHSTATWIKTFEQSNFHIKKTIVLNPFVKTFVLEKNGDSL